MRIALFTDTYLPTVDGVVTSILTARKGLKENGHEVLVFAPECKDSPKEADTVYCKSRKFKMYPGYNIASFLPRELKILKDFDPDVIHTHGVAGMGLKSLWYSKDLKVPTVLTFHTMVTDAVDHYSPLNLRADFIKRLLKLYLKAIIQRYTAVIVPALSILPEIEEIAPKMKHVEVVPTGVDCDRFSPDVDGSMVKEKWDLNDNEIILHVGRMAEEKRLDVVIGALPFVKKGFPKVKLLLVGDGPAVPKYKQLVHDKGLDRDVIFAGFVNENELPQYYACCDLFATASKFETQGLVILEALASGKPVVGANYRAIPEYVVENETGFLFEADNIESCAGATVKCLNNSNGLGHGAREFAEKYSTVSSIKKLIEVYRKVVEKKKEIH